MDSQLSFTGFAWKNLWRRRLRALLTLGGIAMAIGAFVGLVCFSRSFEHEWLRMYLSSGTDIAVVQQTFLNTSVSESAGATLKALPIVAQATPMILNLMDLTPEVNAHAEVGPPLPGRPAGGDAGRWYRPGGCPTY
jgi:putative ABC transport system permease protein